MSKRKPAELKLWLAVADITEVSTGETFPLAQLSCYAQKTRSAGLNDIRHCIEIKYPAREYEYEIIDMVGIRWSYFVDAFGHDDDDRGDDDAPQTPIDPEDHGVLVPELFVSLIDSLNIPESSST